MLSSHGFIIDLDMDQHVPQCPKGMDEPRFQAVCIYHDAHRWQSGLLPRKDLLQNPDLFEMSDQPRDLGRGGTRHALQHQLRTVPLLLTSNALGYRRCRNAE